MYSVVCVLVLWPTNALALAESPAEGSIMCGNWPQSPGRRTTRLAGNTLLTTNVMEGDGIPGIAAAFPAMTTPCCTLTVQWWRQPNIPVVMMMHLFGGEDGHSRPVVFCSVDVITLLLRFIPCHSHPVCYSFFPLLPCLLTHTTFTFTIIIIDCCWRWFDHSQLAFPLCIPIPSDGGEHLFVTLVLLVMIYLHPVVISIIVNFIITTVVLLSPLPLLPPHIVVGVVPHLLLLLFVGCCSVLLLMLVRCSHCVVDVVGDLPISPILLIDGIYILTLLLLFVCGDGPTPIRLWWAVVVGVERWWWSFPGDGIPGIDCCCLSRCCASRYPRLRWRRIVYAHRRRGIRDGIVVVDGILIVDASPFLLLLLLLTPNCWF